MAPRHAAPNEPTASDREACNGPLVKPRADTTDFEKTAQTTWPPDGKATRRGSMLMPAGCGEKEQNATTALPPTTTLPGSS